MHIMSSFLATENIENVDSEWLARESWNVEIRSVFLTTAFRSPTLPKADQAVLAILSRSKHLCIALLK